MGLGELRTYAAVAEHWGVHRSAVHRRAQREHWEQRLAEVDSEVSRKTLETVVTSLAEFRAKQAAVGAALVEKGLAAMEKLDPVTVKEALDAIKLGSELQSKAYEPSAKRVEVSVEHTLRERFERFVALPAEQPAPQRLQVEWGSLDDEPEETTNDE